MEVANQFRSPKQSLGDIDAEAAARLIATATDVALVVDSDGVIRDVAFGGEDMSLEDYQSWLGQPWAETVTVESRPKVEEILRDAATAGARPRWRQVNYTSARGADVPVLYSAVPVGNDGRVVAVGRDLRATATLQQRLVAAQQSMERDYARLRQIDARYRLLFQLASEAVLIVDAATRKMIEANPAAQRLLGENARRIAGRAFPSGFDTPSTEIIQSLLATVRAAGRSDDVRVRLADDPRELVMSASLFRQDDTEHFLVRISPLQPDAADAATPSHRSRLLDVVERSPDGFVVTSPEGRIVSANRAFLDMAQLAAEEQVRDESLDRWLGRPGVDLNVLMANLRQHGAVRLFATTLRGEYGYTTPVEISAVSVLNGEYPCLGFTVRNIGLRLGTEPAKARELPRSVEQLTELIGRVSMKEIVREATDVIERLCIEAALELTGDNRASAAEMLGLSRQSLYVKLRRYGLGDLGTESEN